MRTKLEQIFEFRSDENPITKIASLNFKGKIICGFEDGQVKLFDLENLENVVALDCGLKDRITQIAISKNDQNVIVSNNRTNGSPPDAGKERNSKPMFLVYFGSLFRRICT